MSANERLDWRSSTRCDAGTCVEVATTVDQVWVRQSSDPDGPRLTFSPASWTAFLADLKAGRFDRRSVS